MNITELTRSISEFNYGKTERQKQNLAKIGDLAAEFHKKNHIYTKNSELKIDLLRKKEDLFIIEVAHQPLFLPFFGVWKKAIFANHLSHLLTEQGIQNIVLFGFVDQDQSTTDLFHKKKIPFPSKRGYKKVGINIRGSDKWKTVCNQILPPKNEIKNCIDEIIAPYIYSGLSEEDKDISLFKELMYESYFPSSTLSEANARFFSNVCVNVWNSNILFFLYSDLQKKGIFTKEFEYILSRYKEYNAIYNNIISKKKLNEHEYPVKHVPPTRVPFWYHCDCGGKMHMWVKSNKNGIDIVGTCPLCKKKHKITIPNVNGPDVQRIMDRISPEAVSRDLIFANGLGSDIYITGFISSSTYGQITRAISNKWGLERPMIIVLKSKDNYLSIIINREFSNLIKGYLDVVVEDEYLYKLENAKRNIELIEREKFDVNREIVRLKENLKLYRVEDKEFSDILDKIKSKTKDLRELARQRQKFDASIIEFSNISRMINVIPSVVDEFFSVGFAQLLKYWKRDFEKNDFDVEHFVNLPTKKRVVNIDFIRKILSDGNFL